MQLKLKQSVLFLWKGDQRDFQNFRGQDREMGKPSEPDPYYLAS